MKYYDYQIHNKGEGDARPQPFKIFSIHCNSEIDLKILYDYETLICNIRSDCYSHI